MSEYSAPPIAQRPYLVEFLTANGRIAGLTRSVHGRQRLVDLLNDPAPTIDLEGVKATLDGGPFEASGIVTIPKRAILAAIPRETQQQADDLEIQRNLVGRVNRRRIEMTAALPSMIVKGIAHIGTGAGALKFDAGLFDHFFALTEASLTFRSGPLDVPVMLLNRDAVIAVSFTADQG